MHTTPSSNARTRAATSPLSQSRPAAILITITALVSFCGTGFLLLYTNVGKRLAFLITGAATFGWMVIGSMLFVVYAPRGIRPASLEGLNAFQMRIPAIALTVGSAILFVMFVLALDRYESETE